MPPARTSGNRCASADPWPHHDTITVWIPAAAISRICARTVDASDDEYGPLAGYQSDAMSNGGALSFCCQCCQSPSCASVPYQG